MTPLAVTDSHALIWAATGKKARLGKGARRFFEDVERGLAALYVPTIALVEIGEAVQRGRISFSNGFERWTESMFASGRYHPAPLTAEVVLRAQSLYAIPERGDRLIAATAIELDCPLLSRDPALVDVEGLEVRW